MKGKIKMSSDSNKIMTGKVKWFNDKKGFGFIIADDESYPDIFVHQEDILMEGFRTLHEGQGVTFIINHTKKGYSAQCVSPI